MPQNSPTLQGPFSASRSKPLHGDFAAPGDKSISHRSLIFGGLANGNTQIEGLLESEDVINTAKAIAALGADVKNLGKNRWSVTGLGGKFESPAQDLDFGNSGTGARLMMGVVAGTGATARFVGDESLTGRPMRRVTDPLSEMGADVTTTEGRLPVTVESAPLDAISYTPPVASAQVKSALLLAGLGARGTTVIHEPTPTRDHTETMLRLFGAEISIEDVDSGWTISLPGEQKLSATPLRVPGDPSSAAFAVVAALITPGSDVTLRGVMDNTARTGLYTTLKEMGADLTITPAQVMAGEKTIDIRARYSKLNGLSVPEERAPSMIDEYPILGVAAAAADGVTRMNGLAELRAKESDRLMGTSDLLTANGVETIIRDDGLDVVGTGGDVPGGGHVITHHDHRIAMSALVLGLIAEEAVTIDDASMIATSYPDFLDHMLSLGAQMEPAE
ncbi:3-phosphoshikimate 1-carboxyvinyltransferase [Maricaulis sp.]|uniref:3-phosphoshikimate 1-carboxyvinyltransferase n=1 Tax=unclassified Maricaulis TaxID=2632371 RepID=UPI001B1B0574|nr:3-phosphoshikimate 1-carboxyvinyltransferase [Maricaulis sp.]MBO6796051.1 3-phosphoshikimate 1-carboxyvinyltransferase [Maricaulis sp.]